MPIFFFLQEGETVWGFALLPMTIPTLWLVLMTFKLIKPLLRSKSHLASDIPEDDAIRAPKQDRRAIARGLSVIVEKKNEDNENAG